LSWRVWEAILWPQRMVAQKVSHKMKKERNIMSTNKTPNYALHAWTPQDEFHLTEINENFAALDAGAVRAITGFYTATGQDLEVDVGCPIRALLIFASGGARGGDNAAYATLTVRDRQGSVVKLTDTGFSVAYSTSVLPGFSGRVYYYLALV
ncbi:MAG: hypothetical protein NC311_19340, partial [Muribaculaceae bacterium]|nr:hypothetical protein [Muribaculaceae bacterium]